MELNELITNLLNSKVLANKELGVTLLRSPTLSEEEKEKHINKWIEEYEKNPNMFWTDDNRNLIKAWLDMYRKSKNKIKGRIIKL